jgi:hypothetical protein
MRRLILKSFQSPGDVLMLTAAVRDLHAAAPGQFQTDVRTSAAPLWQNNPHLTPLGEAGPGVEIVDMHYPLIHQSNQLPLHFLHGYAQYLEQRLGLRVPVTRFAGDVHLSAAEKADPPLGVGGGGARGALPEVPAPAGATRRARLGPAPPARGPPVRAPAWGPRVVQGQPGREGGPGPAPLVGHRRWPSRLKAWPVRAVGAAVHRSPVTLSRAGRGPPVLRGWAADPTRLRQAALKRSPWTNLPSGPSRKSW